MKVLYVAVFDKLGESNDISAAVAMQSNEHVTKIIAYNYRPRATEIGLAARDEELINICRERKPDLVFFVKCNNMSTHVFAECKKICPIAYWFPDPLVTYLEDDEYTAKAKISDMVFVDKKNVFDTIKQYNDSVFIVPDGYDKITEIPRSVKTQDIDVSFIGNVYGDRLKKIEQLKRPLTIINNAYGKLHSRIVSRSKININFCTSEGPSNRIYKILAARGFLLTDDWIGRVEHFEDGKHLVIFKDVNDLNEKISYYLHNDEERIRIAQEGYSLAHNFTRNEWARKVINVFKKKYEETNEKDI